MKQKLKLILEVEPKTPSEVLASQLRQTRLTLDRLRSENKELEFKLREAERGH